MKFLTFAFILGLTVSSVSGFVPTSKNDALSISFQSIENGWYEAMVAYNNPKTYQRSNYRLSVKVENNRVTAIDFGNGGSVHTGYNNSGYSYYGGNLTIQKDFNGRITSATAKVSVSDTNGVRYYDITIQ